MIFSKNKILFLFIISAFLFLTTSGCSRKVQDSSVIQLSLPGGMGSSKITEFKYSEPMSMQSASAQSEDEGAEWNSTMNPGAIGDVNCYMILVSGPESDMGRNTCVTTTGQNLRVGRWNGGIPTGGVLSLEVPSGPQREITVVGFKAAAGSCTNFKNSDVNGSSLSEPHILGKIVKDLSPGSVAVTIPVTVNAGTLKIDDCTGPDFNMEQAPLYFGDLTTGTQNVSSPQTYAAMGGAEGRVIAFDETPVAPNENFTFLETAANAPFAAGDEVMLIVQGMSGGWTGSGNSMVGPCGYRAWEGRYTFARVMETSVAPYGIFINRGTFLDKLGSDTTGAFNAGLHSTVVTNLGNPPDANSGVFCRIKAVKVLHFYDLNINAGGSIAATPFDFDSEATGILPIRVANNLNLADTSGLSAAYKGYAPLQFKHGSGLGGITVPACSGAPKDTRTGGSCGIGSNGGGGGGHGNLPGGSPFTGSGGNGGGGSLGGDGAGDDCGDGSCFGNLSYKMFLGGAGGGGAQTGLAGHGGGIIYLMAKNVIVPASANTNFSVKGNVGGNAVSPGYGAHGGGAGGSVVFGFKNMNIPNTSFLQIHANGGDGGIASGTGGSGGGAGAGGRIHIIKCQSSVYPPASLVSHVFTGNPGGTSSGSIGLIGSTGTVVTSSIPCN